MYSLNFFDNLESLSIYLTRPNGDMLACLDNYIDENSVSLLIGLNQQYELSFDIYFDEDSESSWRDYIQEGMYLLVEKIGLFKMNQPESTLDGIKEVKRITAYSCDIELEDKNCTLELNMGTKTSQEYLVEYDDNETELLINPYTDLPYDWLVLYNTFPEQLDNLLEKYDNDYFGTKNTDGEIIITDENLIDEMKSVLSTIPRLCNKFVEKTESSDAYSIEYVATEYDLNTDSVSAYILRNSFRNRIIVLKNFYTKYRNQLSLLSLALENTGGVWSVGEIFGVSNGDFSLANRKFQFDVDSTIYSFLTQTLAQATSCVVNFDIYNRKVNVTPIENIGKDTGIVIDYDSLLNTLDISSNEDKLATRLYVTGENDLNVEQVNFGSSYIDNILYKINATNQTGTNQINSSRIYVSDELAEKYNDYYEFREEKRNEYISLSRQYRKIDEQISEIMYRVPNDNLSNDWSTFSREELDASLTSFNNLLIALEQMYKYDYGSYGLNPDGTINEEVIKTTFYWYDYVAYKNIIKEIECAIDVFPYYNDTTKWTSSQLEEYLSAIKAWETEWSLYGIKELQAKIDSYTQNMSLLAESSVIKKYPDSDEIKTWNELTDAEKSEFGYYDVKYYYNTYMDYYNKRTDAQEYLGQLQTQVDELNATLEYIKAEQKNIVKQVSLEENFTDSECKEIYQLYRDADYSNSNILITSIDTSDDKIDRMVELLEDGKEQVSIMSRPQLTFKANTDNLLALKDYKALWNYFEVGNYMFVKYRDNSYIKLRMVSFEFNPRIPTGDGFSITFSNFIRSSVSVNDIESILGSSTNGGSSRSGSSSSSRNGDYGQSDNIDITISNTMLARLLNSELFGKQVTNIISNTIDVNALNSKTASNTDVTEVKTIAESAVQDVTILFAKSNSQTTAPVTGWSTDAPDITDGEYIWQKTITTYGNGEIESDVVCMTGKNGENALTVYIDSSAGVMFKRKGINTILTATVYYGTEDVTDDVTAFHWIKRDKDGVIDTSWSRENAGRSITLSPQDVQSKAIFVCEIEYTP